MTDRPASWRMPTPKQMEKLVTEAARMAPVPAAAPDEALPPEYWNSLLKDPRGGDGVRTTKAIGDPRPCAAHLLPPLRADYGNPDRRCGQTLWRQRNLEGCRATAARRYVPATHRKTRRRRVLAWVREVVGMVPGKSRTPAPLHAPWESPSLSGTATHSNQQSFMAKLDGGRELQQIATSSIYRQLERIRVLGL
jgi:hypothetical protein